MKHLNNPYILGLGEEPGAIVCVNVSTPTYTYVAGDLYVGNTLASIQTSSTGTAPITYSLTAGAFPTGMTLTGATGLISGTPTTTGTYTFTVRAANSCPSNASSSLTVSVRSDNTAYNQRAGNFVYADAPAAAPTFTADMFLGLDARYTEWYKTTSGPGWVGSTITFPAQAGARQVIWLGDSVVGAGRTFTVNGFPLVLTPSANTPIQSLTINGVPGKVYFTANQNTGGFTLNLT